MNKYLKTGLIFAFILALILIPAYCGLNQFRARKTVKKADNVEQYKSETKDDSILKKIAIEKEILACQYDSLLKVKQKAIRGKERVRDSLIYISDSACKNSLIILYNECQKTDSVNNNIISNLNQQKQKDSTSIATLTHKVSTKQERINRDSTRIEQLNDTIPKVKRKGFVKGFLIGFGSGAAAKQGVDLLIKIKP